MQASFATIVRKTFIGKGFVVAITMKYFGFIQDFIEPKPIVIIEDSKERYWLAIDSKVAKSSLLVVIVIAAIMKTIANSIVFVAIVACFGD